MEDRQAIKGAEKLTEYSRNNEYGVVQEEEVYL